MKADKLGWIIAAGMAGALAMTGFQGQSLKFASCDVEKVFNNSNLFKQNSDELERYQAERSNVLRFLVANREMAPQDAKNFAKDSLAKVPSDAEKAELEKIKTDAAAEVAKHRALMTKTTPTAEEQTALQNFSATMQVNNNFAQTLDQQYSAEVQTERIRLQGEALEKVRKTIRDLATKQGYNIVFSTDAAPYAANNITDEALAAVNKS